MFQLCSTFSVDTPYKTILDAFPGIADDKFKESLLKRYCGAATAGNKLNPLLYTARKVQPDKTPQDPKVVHNFQVTGEAYQVLSDPDKREAYEKNGKAGVQEENTVITNLKNRLRPFVKGQTIEFVVTLNFGDFYNGSYGNMHNVFIVQLQGPFLFPIAFSLPGFVATLSLTTMQSGCLDVAVKDVVYFVRWLLHALFEKDVWVLLPKGVWPLPKGVWPLPKGCLAAAV
ncbi:chaperone protein DnaJ 10-like protein isoform X1 [Tanacetum coccineum]